MRVLCSAGLNTSKVTENQLDRSSQCEATKRYVGF